MNEQMLLNASDDDYMNEEQLAYFDERLRQLRAETLEEVAAIRADIAQGRVSDMNDRASLEEASMIAIRIVERKLQLIPKIDAARQRIRQGEYGYCLKSGEPIGIARLLVRPTAEYSTDIKTLNEEKEHQYER